MTRYLSQGFFRATGSTASRGFLERTSLVLAPHPDDETLGCGVTIARKRRAGTQVVVVVVADDSRPPTPSPLSDAEYSAMRRAEALTALTRLGVGSQDVHFLGFPDGRLEECAADVARALESVARSVSPEQVFVTSRQDRHPDHACLGRIAAALLASGALDAELYEYPIWQRVPPVSLLIGAVRSIRDAPRQPVRTSLRQLRPRLVRTDGDLATKRHALEAYVSQLPVFPPGFVEDFLQPLEVFVPVLSAGRGQCPQAGGPACRNTFGTGSARPPHPLSAPQRDVVPATEQGATHGS